MNSLSIERATTLTYSSLFFVFNSVPRLIVGIGNQDAREMCDKNK